MTTVTRARGLTATGQDTVTAWSHGRLIITLVILRITRQSFVTVQRDPGSELANAEAPSSDDGPAHGGHGHGHDRPVAERDNASATSVVMR